MVTFNEAVCRRAFDDMYHKIPAAVSYDEWIRIWQFIQSRQTLIGSADTPNWSDAPEWAQYVAQDWAGDWFWYESMPTKLTAAGAWKAKHREHYHFAKSSGNTANDNWASTLERRP